MRKYLVIIFLIMTSCIKKSDSNLSNQIEKRIKGYFQGSILIRYNDKMVLNNFFNDKSQSQFSCFNSMGGTNDNFKKQNCTHKIIKKKVYSDSVKIDLCPLSTAPSKNLKTCDEIIEIITKEIISNNFQKKKDKIIRHGE